MSFTRIGFSKIFSGIVFLLFLLAASLPMGRAATAADWATVVMYHRFGEDSIPSTSIRLDQFEAHLAEIKAGPYTVLPLDEIIDRLQAGEALPDRTLAITVDDAYQSVYDEAWPRLKEAGLPFTLFVATESVDRGIPGYMSWDKIREMQAAGVTIGSQTAGHAHMNSLSAARNAKEIARSNARFQKELGITPTLFAYPFGEFGNAVKEVVRQSGFKAAFGQHSGVVHAGQDFLALPRFAMNESYGSIGRFKLAANALPLRVTDVMPPDNLLTGQNPPLFGFTVTEALPRLDQLGCFASNQSEPARIERLGKWRFEVRLDAPFAPGRGRINCTVPGPDKRWRWFGTQFHIPKN